MHATDDLVVVQLHHRVPVIDDLREIGERQAPEHDPRLELPALAFGADFSDDAIQLDAVPGPLQDELRVVLLAVLIPRHLCARRSVVTFSARRSMRCRSVDVCACGMTNVDKGSMALVESRVVRGQDFNRRRIVHINGSSIDVGDRQRRPLAGLGDRLFADMRRRNGRLQRGRLDSIPVIGDAGIRASRPG